MLLSIILYFFVINYENIFNHGLLIVANEADDSNSYGKYSAFQKMFNQNCIFTK